MLILINAVSVVTDIYNVRLQVLTAMSAKITVL